jgi:serine/threonine-protein kinase PknK
VLAGVSGGQDVLEDIERRGLFLRRTDEEPRWFRYHEMLAGPLHGRLRYAVDHALAAGDDGRAVALVEQDRTIGSVNQARMTNLLGIVDKPPPHLLNSRPRLHLTVAVANILLQRPAATEAALDRVADAISRAALPEAKRADLALEANVLRGWRR